MEEPFANTLVSDTRGHIRVCPCMCVSGGDQKIGRCLGIVLVPLFALNPLYWVDPLTGNGNDLTMHYTCITPALHLHLNGFESLTKSSRAVVLS